LKQEVILCLASPTYEELEQRVKELEQRDLESKQTEEALQESEEIFRTLVEASPFGISIMKSDRSFEYFNPEFTDIFGYTLEVFAGQTDLVRESLSG